VDGNKMSDAESNEEEFLDDFELGNELSEIVAKNLLPSRITDRIKEKLKEKNVKIGKQQLYSLVEKIRGVMLTYSKSLQTNNNEVANTQMDQVSTESESASPPEEVPPAVNIPLPIENTDMKNLVELVEQLKDRVENIEQNQLKWKKEGTGKMVATEDIDTVEKVDAAVQWEEIQPLTEISNDPETIVVLMKWLQHLVDKVGKNHLPDILGYYVDIGWISYDVKLNLMEYSKGIIEENTEVEKRESFNLPTKDHIQSLLFIQRIKGKQLDERFMSKIDREMEKITKSLDNYQFK
jgi:archaellum component FlaD/FlaE